MDGRSSFHQTQAVNPINLAVSENCSPFRAARQDSDSLAPLEGPSTAVLVYLSLYPLLASPLEQAVRSADTYGTYIGR